MIERQNGDVTQYVIRQSWLNKFVGMCQASAIWDVQWLDDGTPPSTATAIGTTMHAGIEQRLLGAERPAVIEAMTEAWEEQRSHPGFKSDVSMSDVEALHMAAACYKAWEKEIYPTLPVPDPDMVEHKFSVKVDHREVELYGEIVERSELWIEGTWDALIDGVLWDWKTGSNPSHYSPNEIERKIQPSLYTFAAAKLGLVDPTEPVPFKYGVVYKRKTVQCPTNVYTTHRNPQQWAFLIEQMWQAVAVWRSNAYTLNNQGWWCSPKFCEHYSACVQAPREAPVI